MQLRPYQQDIKYAALSEWGAGHRNVLLVMPTGAGKTVTMGDIIRDTRGEVYAIAHRQELVSQISVALAREGVRHNIIAPKKVVKLCVNLHVELVGKSYFSPVAQVYVAGVDTLGRRTLRTSNVALWVMDEAHHVLQDNKWGRVVEMFPNARGLGVTATPLRTDGKGLGSTTDGFFDTMVVGPSMRELITMGYLTDYRIYAPKNDLDLSDVKLSASTGDYNPHGLSMAVKRSRIIGDIVEHYIKHARGKLGVSFLPDVESAGNTAQQFRNAGIPAEMVHAGTSDFDRVNILRKFARREVLELVNVDLFGEGFDLPAIEVVSMGRPTQSYGLYCLDPETEVLTAKGWESYVDLSDIQNVYAFDIETGEVKETHVTGRVKRALYPTEHLYGTSGPHIDILVSDKHDMVIKSASDTCVNWQKQKAEAVANRNSMFRVPVAGFGKHKGAGLTIAELHFIGWFLSDGCLNKKTNAIQITQSVKKQKHILHIKKAIEGCGFKYGEYLSTRKNCPETHNDLLVMCVSKGKPRGRDSHLTGWSRLEAWLDKSVPSCFDSLTRDEFLTMLEAINLGDGVNNHSSLNYVKRTLTITCGDNEVMADRLQALCVLRGLRCNKATQNYRGRGVWFSLHIRDAQTATIAGYRDKDGAICGKKEYKRSRFERQDKTDVPFVWCLSNELGTLITRRNGKVAIVGNCQQFGRVLRPFYAEGYNLDTQAGRLAAIANSIKPNAIIFDHVGNVMRHGLPDAPKNWTLDRREKRSSGARDGVEPVTVCPNCTGVYERFRKTCPYCLHTPVPTARNAPEFVDGDLLELDAETLAVLRGDLPTIEEYNEQQLLKGVPPAWRISNTKKHGERLEAGQRLRESIAVWAGEQRSQGFTDSEIYRKFYLRYGVDILSAQKGSRAEMDELNLLLTERR
jgi:superfamily II DNA or RNA helicase